MQIEMELSPVVATEGFLELARLVDDAGADRLGISDVALMRDSFMIQALCAGVTQRVRVGSVVTNPYVRHPATVAAALATLNEVSRGRAFLGIGVGAGLSGLGIDQSQPARRLEEFILLVKRMLDGETVDWKSSNYRIDGARIAKDIAAPVPVVVGTRSRRVANLAGRVADAVVVGAREMTCHALQRYRDWVNEGAEAAARDPEQIEIAPRVTVCVSADGDWARRSVTLYAAHYLSLGGFDDSGLSMDRFERIKGLTAQATGWYFEPNVQYPSELDTLITPDLIARFAIAGTPMECLRQVQRLAEMGFGSVSMNVAAVRRPSTNLYDGLRETLEGLGEITQDIQRL